MSAVRARGFASLASTCSVLLGAACTPIPDQPFGMMMPSNAMPVAGEAPTSAAGTRDVGPAAAAVGGRTGGVESTARSMTPNAGRGTAGVAAGDGGRSEGAAGATTMLPIDAGAMVAGADGAAGQARDAGIPMAAGSGSTPAMRQDLMKGDGSDVVTIGDSWMKLMLTGIEQSLDRVSGQRYRHYAVPGTRVLNEQIPNQFKQAVAANPMIKTLIMTGGGNDILTSPCAGTACNTIVDDVAERLMAMLTDINLAGVQDVVIIGYTYPADESKHVSLDHMREVSMQTCMKTGMPRCHFVDSSKLQIMLSDGIQPNAAGCDLIAKTVFDLMTSEGMRR